LESGLSITTSVRRETNRAAVSHADDSLLTTFEESSLESAS